MQLKKPVLIFNVLSKVSIEYASALNFFIPIKILFIYFAGKPSYKIIDYIFSKTDLVIFLGSFFFLSILISFSLEAINKKIVIDKAKEHVSLMKVNNNKLSWYINFYKTIIDFYSGIFFIISLIIFILILNYKLVLPLIILMILQSTLYIITKKKNFLKKKFIKILETNFFITKFPVVNWILYLSYIIFLTKNPSDQSFLFHLKLLAIMIFSRFVFQTIEKLVLLDKNRKHFLVYKYYLD